MSVGKSKPAWRRACWLPGTVLGVIRKDHHRPAFENSAFSAETNRPARPPAAALSELIGCGYSNYGQPFNGFFIRDSAVWAWISNNEINVMPASARFIDSAILNGNTATLWRQD